MPVVSPNFDCSSVQSYCPGTGYGTSCVQCDKTWFTIKNNTTTIYGSQVTVKTVPVSIDGYITTVAIYTTYSGAEWDASLRIRLLVNNTEIFIQQVSVTGQSATQITLTVNKQVNGNVVVVYEVLSERVGVGSTEVTRMYSCPTIAYETTTQPSPQPSPTPTPSPSPTPTPSPTQKTFTVTNVYVTKYNTVVTQLYTTDAVTSYRLRFGYSSNSNSGVAKAVISINGRSIAEVPFAWDLSSDSGTITIYFTNFAGSAVTIGDFVNMYAPNASSIQVCVDVTVLA
jgi:hypothetical protein